MGFDFGRNILRWRLYLFWPDRDVLISFSIYHLTLVMIETDKPVKYPPLINTDLYNSLVNWIYHDNIIISEDLRRRTT